MRPSHPVAGFVRPLRIAHATIFVFFHATI
jgi:hypothetical protein